MHRKLPRFLILRNTKPFSRNNIADSRTDNQCVFFRKLKRFASGAATPVDGSSLQVRNWAASILARGRCTTTTSSSSSSQVHSRICSSPLIQSSELRAVCPLAQSDFPRLVQAIALARPGALSLGHSLGFGHTNWQIRPWRHISAKPSNAVVRRSVCENKKLRYREEHSASVVLSWGTWWHLSGDKQQINS